MFIKNWKELEAMMELNSLVDKHTFCVKKNDTILEHLFKGPNGYLAKTIFFSLRGTSLDPARQ